MRDRSLIGATLILLAVAAGITADVYAFIFGQKGLMAGLGLQGSMDRSDIGENRMRDRISLHVLAGSLSQPINCATARQEIQTLQSQKVSKSEEAAAGVSYALPTRGASRRCRSSG